MGETCDGVFWRTEIANIIDESVSNGFIEGSNNKIKVLKRISYGVRNFERFRNRILYPQLGIVKLH